MGDVSDTRKQILQNTLEDELKSHFRLVPQEKYEEVLEKVFEELEFEECNEDTCIMRIQEMLQVENVFHLQVIGEGKDTQLSLGWRTFDEKRKEEEFCERCGTRELREMIGGMVEKLVGEKNVEQVVSIRRNESYLKKKKEQELKKKKEQELKKKKEEELTERKRLYFKTRKLSIVGGWICTLSFDTYLVSEDDSSSTTLDTLNYYGGINLETKYYFSEKLSVSGDYCSGSATNIFTITKKDGESTNSDSHDGEVKVLSGRSELTSILLNYSWNFDSSSIYIGGGISYHSAKIEYLDYISSLNHSLHYNSLDPSLIIGYEYIFFIQDKNLIIDIKMTRTISQKSLEITNSTKKYKTRGSNVLSLIRFGHSF
jgi:hypothetical protein